MRSKLKTAVATLMFAIAFTLVGSPSAPLAKVVPTVGGVAHAYAPCDLLLWNIAWAAADYMRDPTYEHLERLRQAHRDWVYHCLP